MNLANFDAASVDWQPLPGPDGNPEDHIEMSIMNVDDEAKIVDVLFSSLRQMKKFCCTGIRRISTHLLFRASTGFMNRTGH